MAGSAFGPGLEADLVLSPSGASECFDGFGEDFSNVGSICRLIGREDGVASYDK